MLNFAALKTGLCITVALLVLAGTTNWTHARTAKACQASYNGCKKACYGPYGPRDRTACVSNCTRKYSDCIYDIYTRTRTIR